MWCSLCLGPQSLRHYTFQCPVYQTPAAKRQRLWTLELCSNCTRPRHEGECSASVQECWSHPGVRHYRWLCEAQWQPQNQQFQQQQNQQYNQMQYQGGQA